MNRATLFIATRNRAIQLGPALKSIVDKDYQDLDILVVDDGSTDETAAVAERFKNCGVRYIKLSHEGGYRSNPSVVLNFGHRIAGNEIVIEQGGEVCHVTDCISPLVEVCRPGMAALARVHHGEPEEMLDLLKAIESQDYVYPEDFMPENIQTCGDHWAVPRVGTTKTALYCGRERPAPFIFLGAIHQRDFKAIGGYDEGLRCNNDGDLARRLWAVGVRFCFVGRAVAFHLKHEKS